MTAFEPQNPPPATAIYTEFLEELERKLSSRRRAASTLQSTSGVHRQLLRLLSSFGDFSPVQRNGAARVEEWNPLSQRPVVPERELATDALDQDFESQAQGVRHYIGTAHEITHCLLWEPFFAGSFLPTRSQFTEVSLAFEGFCFWHSDIVLTRRIRALTPDNELVHKRNCVSQIHFHPYRAFEAAGVTDDLTILDFYLAAFTGHRTPLHGSDDLFVRNLVRRTIKLYITHCRSLPAVYRELNRAGTFREFYRRFCARPGLPALVRSPFDPGQQTFDYLRWMATVGMPSLSRVPDGLVERVRARRRIQTRAYHALQLMSLLRDGRLSRDSGAAAEAAQATLAPRIERYLDRLDQALQALVDSDTAGPAEALVAVADSYYEADVRRRAERLRLWVASRTLILGPTTGSMRAGQSVNLGASSGLAQASGKALRRLVHQAIGVYLSKVAARAIEGKDTASLVEAMTLGAQLVRCLDAVGVGADRTRDELAARLTQFLHLDLIRPQWSVPVGSLSPAQGRFRELAFIFE